jgi:hypothetical protein
MHAYREVIRGCHGATVIYPGDGPELFPANANEPVDHRNLLVAKWSGPLALVIECQKETQCQIVVTKAGH